jgi:hypothetical protein
MHTTARKIILAVLLTLATTSVHAQEAYTFGFTALVTSVEGLDGIVPFETEIHGSYTFSAPADFQAGDGVRYVWFNDSPEEDVIRPGMEARVGDYAFVSSDKEIHGLQLAITIMADEGGLAFYDATTPGPLVATSPDPFFELGRSDSFMKVQLSRSIQSDAGETPLPLTPPSLQGGGFHEARFLLMAHTIFGTFVRVEAELTSLHVDLAPRPVRRTFADRVYDVVNNAPEMKLGGVGFVPGAYLFLDAGATPPAGFTKVGTWVPKIDDVAGHPLKVVFDVYKKN